MLGDISPLVQLAAFFGEILNVPSSKLDRMGILDEVHHDLCGFLFDEKKGPRIFHYP